MQIKSRALHTYRLLIINNWIFQYIINWSKVFELLPTFCLQYRVLSFDIFRSKQFFSWLCRFIYKLGRVLFIYHSWYNSYKKVTIHQRSYFFWCNFSIKLPYLWRRENKINTRPYDKYYLQNGNPIIWKITNHTKSK